MSPFAGWLMPDENEQDALSKIKAYLDVGHSLDALTAELRAPLNLSHSGLVPHSR